MKPSLITLVVLLSSFILVVFTGCSEEDPFDKLTSIDNGGDSVTESKPRGLLPDLSQTEDLGNAQVGQDIKLDEITENSGIDFTYRNGRDAGNNSILESLGGGVAILDYDLNGTLDIFFPGGGKYEGENKQKITGLPGALYSNNGDAVFANVSTASYTDDQTLYTHGCQAVSYTHLTLPTKREG